MKYRHRVLGFLCVLAVITYVDRVCISVAGPRMQESLQIGPKAWGWVVGIFGLAYSLFEVPTGHLGDRIGPRRVLTRIVVWWSAFTSFTGLVSNYYLLLLVRFSFGAGEAGAFPNFGICLSRWFPVVERARAMGYIFMGGQLGGAIAPFLIVPLQARFGWRASFFVLGLVGVLWCIPWYWWFRDKPDEMAGVTAAEREEIGPAQPASNAVLPWREAIRSANLWAIMGVAFCYIFGATFFLSWLHTFLVKGRGFSEGELMLSTVPSLLGACGNVGGGYASDWLVKRVGLKWGRRAIGMVSLSVASLSMIATILTTDKYATLLFLGVVYAAISFQQTVMGTVVIDVGRKHVGAVFGAMNMAAQTGGFVFSVSFGYLLVYLGSYDRALIPIAGMLALGALVWLRVDATEGVVAD